MVARPIRSGDTCPVEHEGHACLVQGHIHQHLVKRAVDEGGVNRHHRVEATVGETGRAGHSMLFGDSHVENPLGVCLCHLIQAGGSKHCRGDTNHLGVFASLVHHRLSKHFCPALASGLTNCLASCRVNLSHRVELVSLIVDGWCVTSALFRNDVDNHRLAVRLRLSKRTFQVA